MMIEAIQEMENHFKAINRMHGDVRLGNIFVSEDGSIKFTDVYLINWRVNGLMKALLSTARPPLAPEIMTKLKEDHPNDESTPENEIWSIGIVVLCMASLKKESFFYEWRSK